MTSAQAGLILRHIRKLATAPPGDELLDGQLLEQFAVNQNEAAFANLVRRHGSMVLNVCRSVLHHLQDAEDAFQATFLVLAREAGSIRQRESVGGWLYRVAYHVAVKAKAKADRRREHERKAEAMPSADPLLDMTWREVRVQLYEELQHLPENYRAPLVLCYLEGKSQEEAARQLGWTKGTLRGRLDRAREHLRRRLSRRGLALSAGLVTAVLTQAPAAGALPSALLDTTVKAAVLCAAGGGLTTGVISTRVVALTQGVSKALFLTKFNIVTGLVLLVTVACAGTAVLTRQMVFAKPIEPRSEPAVERGQQQAPDASTVQAPETIEISGRVLDPEGKPCAGAPVYFYLPNFREDMPADGSLRARATSAADGRFLFRILQSELGNLQEQAIWSHPTVAACCRGYGPAWVTFARPGATTGLTLKLVKDDIPIDGRVLDLEARPIAGVAVRVLAVFAAPDENLKPWLESSRTKRDGRVFESFFPRRLDSIGPVLPERVFSGADGRFRLTGMGRDRMVQLLFEGATIETCRNVSVLTRPGPPFQEPVNRNYLEFGNLMYYGATFVHLAAPTRPISGVVRDLDTGKPLADVSIRSHKFAGTGTLVQEFIRTTSDKQGRYRLLGMPKGEGHEIMAAPADGQAYLASVKTVGGGPGAEPVQVDFALKRAVLVRGRVTDQATGKPVRARVEYFAFLENPYLPNAPGFHHGNSSFTRSDGSFTLVGLPGRGMIAAAADEDRFLIAVGADRIKGADRQGLFRTEPRLCVPFEHHALVEINPSQNADSLACDLVLDPGRTMVGTIVGADGQPLDGVRVSGLKAMRSSPERLPSARFTATALDPRRRRPLFFVHQEKQLGAVVLLPADEPRSLTVRLQPCGSVTGRILDAERDPRPGLKLAGGMDDGQLNLTIGRGAFSIMTAADGRFRLQDLIPGVKYSLYIDKNVLTDFVFQGLTVRPGESRDLGDVKVQTAN